MTDFVIILALALVLGGAALYIYKAKKRGKKCIGCPDSGSSCSGSCGGCNCGCGK